jgi:mannose/fructose/N-acetylgalactosamine-specific phosphotransferase system component IIC
MSNFRNWYVRNQDAITWFLIGFLVMSCINNLSRGAFGWAVFDAVIAYFNYKLNDIRLQ